MIELFLCLDKVKGSRHHFDVEFRFGLHQITFSKYSNLCSDIPFLRLLTYISQTQSSSIDGSLKSKQPAW
jgi:hypothetical protein